MLRTHLQDVRMLVLGTGGTSRTLNQTDAKKTNTQT